MPATDPNDPIAAELLLEREAKGLQIPAGARIALSLFGGLTALDVPSLSTQVLVWSLVVLCVAVNACSIYFLRQRRFVSRIGALGVGIDVVVVLAYPFIQRGVLASEGLHFGYALKGLIVVVYISMVAVNGLALQPKYPAFVGSVAIGTMVALLAAARADPALVWAKKVSLVGPALNFETAVTQIGFLSFVVGLVSFLDWAARAAVVEAATRQAERDRMRREYEASMMEGRLDALRSLVASLSHELNTPVGAIKSSVNTIATAAERLRSRLDNPGASDAKTQKLLRIVSETSEVPVEASGRIDEVVKRMAAFAALDQSDADPVNVNEAIETTLARIPSSTRGTARVELDLAAERLVSLSAPRFNLALMTVLTNAFEAVRGEGEVRVTTRDIGPLVCVTVADDGPGLPPALLPQLFEFRFDRSGQRVKAGFGLPAAYSLLTRHGGDLRVQSDEGRGATFTLEIPAGPNRDPPTSDRRPV